MSVPQLLGPIDTGSSFMITSIQNNQPFILNAAGITGGFVYYWESNLTTIAASPRVGVFTAQGTLDSLVIHDDMNGGGIGFRSDGVTIGNAPRPATVKMSQSSFANWFPPDIFLSTVQYTLYNPSGATASILTSVPGTGGTGPTILANNLIILPVLWYTNCTASGNYTFINQPPASIINWFCVASPGLTGCSGISLIQSGWTNLEDCMVGDEYEYCPTGDICGDSNCKGPCTEMFDDCNFSSGNYVCVFDPNKFFSSTQWWESPYFIGAIIAIILLIIVIIIMIYVIARHP